jgi:hypothetical protein
MTLAERYGMHSTRIISLMRSFNYPFRNVLPTDRILILTDDAMDPLIWQAAAAGIRERGADPVVALYQRRAYHNADPPEVAIAAAKGADVLMALTTTALNSGTPGLRAIRHEGGGTGKTPVWLCEELTQEIMIDGGGKAGEAEITEICDIQRRVGEVYDAGQRIHVTSASGTDITADITGYAPGAIATRWSEIPFGRDPETGKLGDGTWPFGEVHVEPVPGTANGVVVWDQTAHHPPGQWRNPVRLEIENGRVVNISGGSEAREVRWYLDTFGDEHSLDVGGEISLGTNKLCPWGTGQMRSEKKRYGAMHFGIGHGADRGLVMSKLRMEGIIDAVSIAVDGFQVVKDGQILV